MATTTTVGEADLSHSDNNCKYEPYCFCGKSADSVLLYHSYNKYIRSNPNSTVQVSGHGGTSRFSQWKLHAMSNDVFKLQNVHTRKYLRIINNGKTVDVGGTGGKYTLFRAIQSQHHDTSSRRCEPHQISLQSVQFPEYYIAANGQCTVYSFHMNHAQKQNQNDIDLYLYIRPLQMRCTQEQKDDALSSNALKPGTVIIQHALHKNLRVQPGTNWPLMIHELLISLVVIDTTSICII
eukprot:659884_1